MLLIPAPHTPGKGGPHHTSTTHTRQLIIPAPHTPPGRGYQHHTHHQAGDTSTTHTPGRGASPAVTPAPHTPGRGASPTSTTHTRQGSQSCQHHTHTTHNTAPHQQAHPNRHIPELGIIQISLPLTPSPRCPHNQVVRGVAPIIFLKSEHPLHFELSSLDAINLGMLFSTMFLLGNFSFTKSQTTSL